MRKKNECKLCRVQACTKEQREQLDPTRFAIEEGLCSNCMYKQKYANDCGLMITDL